MYKCQYCGMRTDDIDSPPCTRKDHPFTPQEIRTIHKMDRDPKTNVITLLCTGKPPRPGSVYLGGSLGISCIQCRTKMKEAAKVRDAKLYDAPTKEDISLPGDTGNAEIDTPLDETKAE